MPDENVVGILTREIDKDILLRMPLWFRILRENYIKRCSVKSSRDI